MPKPVRGGTTGVRRRAMTHKPTAANPQLEGWEQPRHTGWYSGLSLVHYYRHQKSICGKHQQRDYIRLGEKPSAELARLCRKCDKRSSSAGFGQRGPQPGTYSELQRQASDARKRPAWSFSRHSTLPTVPFVPAGSRGDNKRSSVVPAARRRRKGTKPAAAKGTKPRARSAARATGTKGRKRVKK